MKHSMMKRCSLLVGLSLLLVPFGAATSYGRPVAADNEIQVSGGFFHAQGADSGTLTADVSYGRYFANPAWQLGIRQALNYAFIDDASDAWLATTVPFLNYHFYGVTHDDRFVPYLGVLAGAVWNDDDVTGTLGPQVGGKFFLNEWTFLQIGYRYEWFFDRLSARGVSNRGDEGNHVVSIGLGFLWGGPRP
jgi:hypothetical protein